MAEGREGFSSHLGPASEGGEAPSGANNRVDGSSTQAPGFPPPGFFPPFPFPPPPAHFAAAAAAAAASGSSGNSTPATFPPFPFPPPFDPASGTPAPFPYPPFPFPPVMFPPQAPSLAPQPAAEQPHQTSYQEQRGSEYYEPRDRSSGDRDRDRDRDRDYDRDRERYHSDRDRERDRDFERDRDRDRDYRDREWERDRRSDRGRGRSPPSKHDRKLVEYDPEMEDYDDGDRYHGHGGRRRGDDSYSDFERRSSTTPSQVVVLKGLRLETNEETIMDRMKVFGAVDEVRVVRDKTTGVSRGFAFVEFERMEDAINFMNHQKDKEQGVLEIDGAFATLEYSRDSGRPPRGGHSSLPRHEFKDWICSRCGGNNFARRASCFMCQAPKPANPELWNASGGAGDEKEAPCPVLVVRGLDLNTNEDTIRAAFSKFASVRGLRLIRDKISHQSRGYAFVEFISTEEAAKVLKKSTNLKIDGAPIRCAYSRRDHLLEPSEQLHHRGKGGPQNHQSKFIYNSATGYYFDPTSGMSYDPSSGYYFDSEKYYVYDQKRDLYLPVPTAQSASSSETTTSTSSSELDSTAKNESTSDTPSTTAPIVLKLPESIAFPPPAKTKNLIAINIVAPTPKPSGDSGITITPIPSSAPSGTTQAPKKPKEKQPKTIFAKKIAGDVQKWNQKSKELQEELKQEEEQAAAGVTFVASSWKDEKSIYHHKKNTTATSVNLVPLGSASTASTQPPTESASSTTATTTTSAPPSSSGTSATSVEGEQITSGTICLLCKRKFNSSEMLQKHVQQSDLHKHNLEMLRLKQEEFSKDTSHVNSESEKPKKPNNKNKKFKPNEEAPTPAPAIPPSVSTPLDSSNVGMKMLKKFGWKEGEGLGKNATGITAPIEAEIRGGEKAGLGSEGDVKINLSSAVAAAAGVKKKEDLVVMAGDSYRDAVLKKARARFFSLMEDDETPSTQTSASPNPSTPSSTSS